MDNIEEIIKIVGLALLGVLALVVLFIIFRSQWFMYRQERKQKKY